MVVTNKNCIYGEKKTLTDKHKILSLGEHSILDKKNKNKRGRTKEMPLLRITAKFYPDHIASCYKHLDKRIIIFDIYLHIYNTHNIASSWICSNLEFYFCKTHIYVEHLQAFIPVTIF